MYKIKIGAVSVDGLYFPEVEDMFAKCIKLTKEGKADFVIERNFGNMRYCNFNAHNRTLYSSEHWWENFEPDFDYFFSTDNDTGMEPKYIFDMIEIAKKYNNLCLVSAAYLGRWEESKNNVTAGFFDRKTGFNNQLTIKEFLETPKDKFPLHVEIVGGGAVLIPRETIKALPAPLWHHVYYKCEGNKYYNMHEDQSLCWECMQKKISVLLARIPAYHRGVVIPIK